MKKILLTILFIFSLTVNIFANNPQPITYNINCAIPEVKQIKIMPPEITDYVFNGAFWIAQQRVSVIYNSSYNGIVRFNCRLRNTYGQYADLPYTILKPVIVGANTFSDFAMLPTRIMYQNNFNNGYGTFYNVLIIDSIDRVS